MQTPFHRNISPSRIDTALFPNRLWTPESGDSGLLIVPDPPSLLIVQGGQLYQRKSNEATPPQNQREEGTFRMSSSGIIIVSSVRLPEPKRVIGHPELASGASVRRGETLYISVSEAIYRQSQGEPVEVHLAAEADDEESLSEVRDYTRRQWNRDSLPDGWTKPLPTSAKMEISEEATDRNGDELSDELRALAERFRNWNDR